jgi:hypothetical protein
MCIRDSPNGFASKKDVDFIKDFLNEGDKTVIITYDVDQAVARNVDVLCGDLGVGMKPLYLDNLKKYASTVGDRMAGNGDQALSTSSDIIKGCKSSDVVQNFYISSTPETQEGDTNGEFIPIKISGNTHEVVTNAIAIRDEVSVTDTIWQIKGGVATLNAPVLAGSGYRLFYSWVSEDDTESFPIKVFAESVNISPDPRDADTLGVELWDYDANDKQFTVSNNVTMSGTMSKGGIGRVVTGSIDFRMPTIVSGLSVYLDSNNLHAADSGDINYVPSTVRAFSVSGCLLPITSKTTTTTTETKESVQTGWKKVITHHPERIVIIPEKFQPIKTNAFKYCGSGTVTTSCKNSTIDDGPIVIAEEVEKFSAFPAGKTRSKIVLISDASIIQSHCGEVAHNDNFIRGLYPRSLDGTAYGMGLGGRRFEHSQKIKAPEYGSPFRFHSASGLGGLGVLFGGLDTRQASGFFGGLENPPTNSVDRPRTPSEESDRKAEVARFETRVSTVTGGYARFSGVFLDNNGPPSVPRRDHVDAGIRGGLPTLMAISGIDYLDSDVFQSGYPGDLFGFSISMSNSDLVVGTPYNGYEGEEVTNWDTDITFVADEAGVVSGIEVCGKGGAGAVFYYNKTGSGVNANGENLPWEYKAKIKPSSINVGIVNYTDLVDAQVLLRNNNYSASDLSDMMLSPDEFGYSVSLDADLLAVGSPKHNYENHHEHIYDSGMFIRKAFNAEFDIPTHVVYDLGTSGVRVDQLPSSGTSVLNNGAVFTFENKLQNWKTGAKKWQYAEKIVAQGNNARKQKSYTVAPTPVAISGSESDHFGESVAIHRARRTDGDYTLAVGAPHHMFASGNVASDEPVLNAGAAYTYDAMLREQPKILPLGGSFIEAKVYGSNSGNDNLAMIINQPTTGDIVEHSVSGVVYSNHEGEIYLEASGKDLALDKGFIRHRPYVTSVNGFTPIGTKIYSPLSLFVSGKPPIHSGNINLYMEGPSNATVYNSMGMHTASRYDASGTMNLALWNPSGVQTSGYMNLHVSGATFQTQNMNLRVRGK